MSKISFNEREFTHTPMFKEWKEFIEAEIGTGKKILDLGCGDGFHTSIVLSVRNKVTAVDFNRPKYASGYKFVKADVEEKLPFPEKSFDIVTCMDIIEHLLEPRKLLENAARYLKDGGKLIVTTPNYLFILRRIEFLFGKPLQTYNDPHIRLFTVHEMKKLFSDAGFRVKKIEPSLSLLYTVTRERLGKINPSLFASNIIYVGEKAQK